ncbi:MAG TPA: response regulator [Pyrinomonadaceae bacterium]|nr:response regulator [Pyrinomonadaceae bacterium]
MNKIRLMIADDERPARMFLKAILQDFEDVEIVGEAENGTEAIEIIRETKPDLALLDLQMPEVTGLDVVRILRKTQMPLVAFVTAYDEYAVQAFELNAVDYLLKPIEKNRLRETIQRAHERLEQTDFRQTEAKKLKAVAETYTEISQPAFIERIPVKQREEIVFVPVNEVVSIVADGELLHITNLNNKRFVINYRLKDLESRLEPTKFVRLSRGALANLEMVSRISPMPGGTYLVALKNGQQISSSRLQSKILREKFLKM